MTGVQIVIVTIGYPPIAVLRSKMLYVPMGNHSRVRFAVCAFVVRFDFQLWLGLLPRIAIEFLAWDISELSLQFEKLEVFFL